MKRRWILTAMALLLVMACLPSTRPRLRGSSVFEEEGMLLPEIVNALSRWEPDRSDWTEMLTNSEEEEPCYIATRYAHKIGNFASRDGPMIRREAADRAGRMYTIVGLDYQLEEDISEPHWFVVPQERTALYEYDPGSRRFDRRDGEDFGPNQLPRAGNLLPKPELNLGEDEMAVLIERLTEVDGRIGYLPPRIYWRFFMAMVLDPGSGRDFTALMDGYYLPRRSLSPIRNSYVTTDHGVGFVLYTALFGEAERPIQRWFLLSNCNDALYEFFPSSGELEEIIFRDAGPYCSYIREKAALGDEVDLTCYTVMEDDETGREYFHVRAHDRGSNVTLDYKLTVDFSVLRETNAETGESRMIQ